MPRGVLAPEETRLVRRGDSVERREKCLLGAVSSSVQKVGQQVQ